MVEARRKHGSFDHRYPPLSAPETPTWADGTERGLEWTAFQARFYPTAHRHDIDALAAYGSYRSRENSATKTRPTALTRPAAAGTVGA